MGFKNMKRDDHGHVISNDETDGQKCQHQSGGSSKPSIDYNEIEKRKNDPRFQKDKMAETPEEVAAYLKEKGGKLIDFDNDYDEEFDAWDREHMNTDKEPDARPNHTKLNDMNLSDSEIWNMAYQYIGNDKLEKLAESLDLDSPQDLTTNDMLKAMPDDDIGDMMRLNGLDDEDNDDNELDLQDAINIADDDVLDEQFGKDTPERKLVGAMKEQPTGISEWDKKHQDFLEKGKSTWNQKLKKGDKITVQDKDGNDVEVYVNGFWKNGELVDEDTYEEGKDNHWHDFRGVGIADKDGKNLGSVNAFQIKKHSREQQNPPMTKEQRQAIREQINKMVASLDDARSLDEAWDIEEGIKELEDMLKKYKGK